MQVYKLCADLIKKVDKKEANFKNAYFTMQKEQKQIPMKIFKQIYSISINCLKKLKILKESFTDTVQAIRRKMTSKQQQEFRINQRYLFYVLQYELFYSKNQKIRGGGYLPKILKKNQKQLAVIIKKYEISYGNPDFSFKTQHKQKMINANISLRVRGHNPEKRREIIENLKDLYEKDDEELKFDAVIPDLIIMKYQKYQELQNKNSDFISKHLIAQTKSSCIPAFVLLQPLLKRLDVEKIVTERPVEILDACAAPGNKTMQLADYLGQVFENFNLLANDKSQKRHAILEKRVEQMLPEELKKQVKCINEDFLKLDHTSEEMKHIRYILCDPSCSGSGMLTSSKLSGSYKKLEGHFKTTNDLKTSVRNVYNELNLQQKRNIKSFQKLQVKILRKAAKFKNVTRIVYSTCSIYEQENEEVVKKFAATDEFKEGKFRLSTALKEFSQRGFQVEDINFKKCIRVNPINEQSDGFFVALFTRKI